MQQDTVWVLGAGASGLAMARYLKKEGRSVTVFDTREAPPTAASLEAFGIALRAGEMPTDVDPSVSEIAISPGLSPVTGPCAALIANAQKKGIPVKGELALFTEALAHLNAETGYAPKLVAVTGTNGKTTTVSLTHRLIEATGLRVALAGNVGPNMLDVLALALDNEVLPDVWVLELSSFQLATGGDFAPDAAAVLNITEDHLDWHGSMVGYATDKARIAQKARVTIVNRDCPWAIAHVKGATAGALRTFGAGAPDWLGDVGLMEDNGSAFVVEKTQTGFTPLFDESDLVLHGRHNTLNAMASLMLIEAIGIEMTPAVKHALLTYRGEAHRVSEVFRAHGVTIVDDSKGTNVGAVEAALKGFAAQRRRVLLVMGGDGKGQDFSPLATPLRDTVAAVALIGKDAQVIAETVKKAEVPFALCATMDEAVAWLWGQRQTGDVLLLSPACASWDMFKNYAHRSDAFIAAAREMAIRGAN